MSNLQPVVFYGAGSGLSYFLHYAQRQGITVAGLCDSDPAKQGKQQEGLPVWSLEDCLHVYPVCHFLISVLLPQVRESIYQHLLSQGISPQRIDSPEGDPTVLRDLCAAIHEDGMEQYFNQVEQSACLAQFWGEDTPFRRMFEQLDLTSVIELACGRGRHVPQYLSRTGSVILVDILEKNIDLCRQRFGDNPKLAYYQNSGTDLSALSDHSYTSLFTYDAMVHFESIDVYHYLQETARVLLPGGRALFHHSNNTHDYKQSFMNSVSGGRNYMSAQLFAHFAHRAGLTILEQQVIDWGYPDLDCLTMVAKP